jgi:hypothetical protein
MSNTKAKRGLVNPMLIVGGQPHHETRKVSSAYATTFYPGMLVGVSANGFVKVKGADANASFLGVCMSFLPAPSGAAATQVHEVQVVTDMKNTTWEVQTSTTFKLQTLIGNNVSMKGMLTRSAGRRWSTMYAGTPLTTALPWKIVGFAKDPKNESNNGSARVLVRLNEATNTATLFHHYQAPTGI